MDPLSQAVTGAALAGCVSKKEPLRLALVLGALGGMAPDLDVLIRSSSDPLLALEYHRHFTHSLPFSPVGGLICAAFFYLFPAVRRQLSFGLCYLFSFLGLATHGLLDACTSYGTRLWWPFAQTRESWNIIAIIDPAYTLPALFLLIAGFRRRSIILAAGAMLWMLSYLGLATWQHHRGTQIATEWLHRQDAAYADFTLRPTFGNLWIWRIIYRDTTRNHWQAHALFLPFWRAGAAIRTGESIPAFTAIDIATYPENSILRHDLERFRFFSDGYLSRSTEETGEILIGDARYSIAPNSMQPLWGITLPATADQHVTFKRAERQLDSKAMLNLLGHEGFTALP